MKFIKAALISAAIALVLAFVYGWGANIIKLVHHTAGVDATFILRLVGVFFAPLGAFMGFTG